MISSNNDNDDISNSSSTNNDNHINHNNSVDQLHSRESIEVRENTRVVLGDTHIQSKGVRCGQFSELHVCFCGLDPGNVKK